MKDEVARAVCKRSAERQAENVRLNAMLARTQMGSAQILRDRNELIEALYAENADLRVQIVAFKADLAAAQPAVECVRQLEAWRASDWSGRLSFSSADELTSDIGMGKPHKYNLALQSYRRQPTIVTYGETFEEVVSAAYAEFLRQRGEKKEQGDEH